MDFKQIQELIKMINKSNIGEITIEQKDFKLSIRQKEDQLPQLVTASPMQYAPPQFSALPASPAAIPTEESTEQSKPIAEKTKTAEVAANTVTIKSPMIGTFYRRATPDKPNYVEEGDVIAPGKIICVIEAMKLFNEIESEVSGKVIKALVEDASPVEFDQPLFIIEI